MGSHFILHLGIHFPGHGDAPYTAGFIRIVPLAALFPALRESGLKRLSGHLCLACRYRPAAVHAPAFLLPEKNTHGHAALCLYPLTLCVHEKESLKQTIQQGFAGLFHICKQELKAVFKDQGVLIFFLLVPLAYPLVYAFIYTNEVVREVPVAVIDNSNTALSRQFIRTVDASADVHIQSHCADMEEGKTY